MIDTDLKRSYYQFLKHIQVGLVEFNVAHKIALSLLFVGIFLSSLLFSALYYRKKGRQTKCNGLVCSQEREPYISIKEGLLKTEKIELFGVKKITLPVLPMMFYVDILKDFRFYIKRMDFLGAMSVKLLQYFTLFHRKNMDTMIVLQEYSFYMSYLTSMIEADGGRLFNIMHGIPGEEASFFRFSKCFVWGEHYKDYYERHYAEKSQFVVAGSIYHNALKAHIELKQKKEYAVVYLMQGSRHASEQEVFDVLELLNRLSATYKVAVKQHPLHYVTFDYPIEILENKDIFYVLENTQVVISHFSTSLLDAKLLGVDVVSYIKTDREGLLDFLEKDEIKHNKSALEKYVMDRVMREHKTEALGKQYIDTNIDPVSVIIDEIVKR